MFAEINTFMGAILTTCNVMHFDSDLAQLKAYLSKPCVTASEISALIGLSHVLCMRARICADVPSNTIATIYNDLVKASLELAHFIQVSCCAIMALLCCAYALPLLTPCIDCPTGTCCCSTTYALQYPFSFSDTKAQGCNPTATCRRDIQGTCYCYCYCYSYCLMLTGTWVCADQLLPTACAYAGIYGLACWLSPSPAE